MELRLVLYKMSRRMWPICRIPKTFSRRHLAWWVCVPAMLMLLFLFPTTFFLRPSYLRSPGVDVSTPPLPLQGKSLDGPVQALIDAIREATRAASGGQIPTFSEHDAQMWEKHNPCQSRKELGPRYDRRPHAKVLDLNPQWAEVLNEYAALHRACRGSINGISNYFLANDTSSSCKFLVADIHGVGLGNKVSLLTSAVLYAVLTQRVLLINAYSYIPWTMCQPFPGSSWLLDGGFPLPQKGWESTLWGKWTGWEPPVWKSSAFFEKGVDFSKAGRQTSPLYAVKIDHSHPETKRFFCNTEQAYATQVPWMYFTGCLYFLPKLFAVPAFRPALEALFPDPSLALTHLLRTVMLPLNSIWEQVKQEDNARFKGAHRSVGIQVRYLWGRSVVFNKATSKRANAHIKQCAAENNILPNIIGKGNPKKFVPNESSNSTDIPMHREIQVLVTSLHTSLYEDLTETYSRHETVTGETVRVAQLTHNSKQTFSAGEDNQALVEVLLLSFVDDLFVTPLSTFGGLAQAYGALTPRFIEMKKNYRSCVQAQTVDLCYQRAQLYYDCPHDWDVDWKPIERVVPYIKRCLPIEEGDGVQLMPPPLS